jgi:preprotein translocase SecE subunit
MDASHDEPEDVTGSASASGAAPRMARYGEGLEGRPARRERGMPERTRDNFFARASKFVRDVRSELGRTTWPNAHEVRNTTIITVIAVIFFAAYLYAADRVFAFLFDQVHKLFGVS